MSHHTGAGGGGGSEKYHQMSPGGGAGGSKKCHVLFEWPLTYKYFDAKCASGFLITEIYC